MKNVILVSVLVGFMLPIYSQESDTISESVRIVAAGDGTIINSDPISVTDYFQGPQGKELRIGWDDSGFATRSFLTFDISSIAPGPGEQIIIDRAILRVYESNTNLHPFDGDGNRAVKVDFLDYGTLDPDDFSLNEVSYCGFITDQGYNVLNAYSLNITELVANEYAKGISAESIIEQLQFRLSLSKDANTSNKNLIKSHWSIFSIDERDYTDYAPVLLLQYTLIRN
jgi:hypothetical protein